MTTQSIHLFSQGLLNSLVNGRLGSEAQPSLSYYPICQSSGPSVVVLRLECSYLEAYCILIWVVPGRANVALGLCLGT